MTNESGVNGSSQSLQGDNNMDPPATAGSEFAEKDRNTPLRSNQHGCEDGMAYYRTMNANTSARELVLPYHQRQPPHPYHLTANPHPPPHGGDYRLQGQQNIYHGPAQPIYHQNQVHAPWFHYHQQQQQRQQQQQLNTPSQPPKDIHPISETMSFHSEITDPTSGMSCMVTPQVLPPQAEGAVLAHAAQTTPVHMVSSAMTQTLMGGASSSSSVSQHNRDKGGAWGIRVLPPKSSDSVDTNSTLSRGGARDRGVCGVGGPILNVQRDFLPKSRKDIDTDWAESRWRYAHHLCRALPENRHSNEDDLKKYAHILIAIWDDVRNTLVKNLLQYLEELATKDGIPYQKSDDQEKCIENIHYAVLHNWDLTKNKNDPNDWKDYLEKSMTYIRLPQKEEDSWRRLATQDIEKRWKICFEYAARPKLCVDVIAMQLFNNCHKLRQRRGTIKCASIAFYDRLPAKSHLKTAFGEDREIESIPVSFNLGSYTICGKIVYCVTPERMKYCDHNNKNDQKNQRTLTPAGSGCDSRSLGDGSGRNQDPPSPQVNYSYVPKVPHQERKPSPQVNYSSVSKVPPPREDCQATAAATMESVHKQHQCPSLEQQNSVISDQEERMFLRTKNIANTSSASSTTGPVISDQDRAASEKATVKQV